MTINERVSPKRLAEIIARAKICDDSVLTDYRDIESIGRELQQYRAATAEPVTVVISSRAGNDTSTIDKALPEGTELYAAPQVTSVDESAFEVWFKSVESGDDENWMEPKYLSREWNDYVARRQLALGAWRAAAAPAVQEEQEVKK